MRAISIRQPWAWLIVRPDLTDQEERAKAIAAGLIKDHENRDWGTRIRERVLVHAAKGMTRAEYEDVIYWLRTEMDCAIDLPPMEKLQRGGFIGSVEIADCVSKSDSKWFFGHYGFVLRDSRTMPFIPYKGSLGFFNVPDSVIQGASE